MDIHIGTRLVTTRLFLPAGPANIAGVTGESVNLTP
jgi:hypothetical protein